MAYNYEYPGVNMNDYNNDWILNKIVTLVQDWASMRNEFIDLKKEFDDLEEYVKNFFSNPEFLDAVKKALDNMLSDGTLEDIVKGLDKYTYKALDVLNYLSNISGDISDGVQSIVDAGYYRLYFPKGVYSFKNIDISNDIEIIGDDGTIFQLLYNGDIFYPLFNVHGNGNVNFSISDVHILGDASKWGAPPESNYGIIRLRECNADIYNVKFDSIYSKHYFGSTNLQMGSIAIIALDCPTVRVRNSTFTRMGGEETIRFLPTNSEYTGKYYFESNKIVDNPDVGFAHLYSFNMFGDYISFRNNYVSNVVNNNSLLNFGGKMSIIENNIIEKSNFSSIFDCQEGNGRLWIDEVIVSKNIVKDTTTSNEFFLRLNSKKAVITDNIVTYNRFINIGTSVDASTALWFTKAPVGDRTVDSVVIENNIFTCNQEAGSSYIAFLTSGLSSTTTIDNLSITGNTFDGALITNGSNFSCCFRFGAQVQICNISSNNFRHLPVDDSGRLPVIIISDTRANIGGLRMVLDSNIFDTQIRFIKITRFDGENIPLYREIDFGRSALYGTQFFDNRTKKEIEIIHIYVYRAVLSEGFNLIKGTVLQNEPTITSIPIQTAS